MILIYVSPQLNRTMLSKVEIWLRRAAIAPNVLRLGLRSGLKCDKLSAKTNIQKRINIRGEENRYEA